ncbi:hypothetical protein COO60DRAFT_1044880 [Scenedesmus sp. NREL 46B-D3]|nr:hypothetical protein COO60DRAFT_1044880 [Scenedesmus sp. NREL 46B-D3]
MLHIQTCQHLLLHNVSSKKQLMNSSTTTKVMDACRRSMQSSPLLALLQCGLPLLGFTTADIHALRHKAETQCHTPKEATSKPPPAASPLHRKQTKAPLPSASLYPCKTVWCHNRFPCSNPHGAHLSVLAGDSCVVNQHPCASSNDHAWFGSCLDAAGRLVYMMLSPPLISLAKAQHVAAPGRQLQCYATSQRQGGSSKTLNFVMPPVQPSQAKYFTHECEAMQGSYQATGPAVALQHEQRRPSHQTMWTRRI